MSQMRFVEFSRNVSGMTVGQKSMNRIVVALVSMRSDSPQVVNAGLFPIGGGGRNPALEAVVAINPNRRFGQVMRHRPGTCGVHGKAIIMSIENCLATDLVLQVSGGPRDGELIAVKTSKCFVGMQQRDPNPAPSHCAIFRGPQGVTFCSYGDSILLNGESKSVHWLEPGDQIQFPQSLSLMVTQLGVQDAESPFDDTAARNADYTAIEVSQACLNGPIPTVANPAVSFSAETLKKLNFLESKISQIQDNHGLVQGRFNELDQRLSQLTEQLSLLVTMATNDAHIGERVASVPDSSANEKQPTVDELIGNLSHKDSCQGTKPEFEELQPRNEATDSQPQSTATPSAATSVADSILHEPVEPISHEGFPADFETKVAASAGNLENLFQQMIAEPESRKSATAEPSTETTSSAAVHEANWGSLLINQKELDRPDLSGMLSTSSAESDAASAQVPSEPDEMLGSAYLSDSSLESVNPFPETKSTFKPVSMDSFQQSYDFNPVDADVSGSASDALLYDSEVSSEPSADDSREFEHVSGVADEAVEFAEDVPPARVQAVPAPSGYRPVTLPQNEDLASQWERYAASTQRNEPGVFDIASTAPDLEVREPEFENTNSEFHHQPDFSSAVESQNSDFRQSESLSELTNLHPDSTFDESNSNSPGSGFQNTFLQNNHDINANAYVDSPPDSPRELAFESVTSEPDQAESEIKLEPVVPQRKQESVAELLARMKAEAQWDRSAYEADADVSNPESSNSESVLPEEHYGEYQAEQSAYDASTVDSLFDSRQSSADSDSMLETPSGANVGDEEADVDNYMSQLLARMRSGKPATVEPKPETPAFKSPVKRPEPANLPPEPTVAPMTPEEFKPKRVAPKIESFSAMREIANTTARTAIASSEEDRLRALAYVQFGIAGSGVLMAAYYFGFQFEALFDTSFFIGTICLGVSGVLSYLGLKSLKSSKQARPSK